MPKTRTAPPPKHHHLDRRASSILAASSAADNDDDELLTTKQLADWFQVSTQWLEIGRHRGYGPAFERLGPKMIRYRRGKARDWLNRRSHSSTGS